MRTALKKYGLLRRALYSLQELTKGLGGVKLAHGLHYPHHVNLADKCLLIVSENTKFIITSNSKSEKYKNI